MLVAARDRRRTLSSPGGLSFRVSRPATVIPRARHLARLASHRLVQVLQ